MKKIAPLALMGFFLLISCGDDDSNNQSTDDDGTPGTSYSVVNAFPNLGFSQPLDLQSPDDGTNRIFVVEQGGTIRVFSNDENASESTIFLDISDRVSTQADELGLLGLAFHPDFATNGYFYVNYTPDSDLSITSRFQVSPLNSNTVDANSEVVLLQIPQPFTNHNGGQLTFGLDGYLYIASGDGGSGGDPDGHAQNLANLLGAILRIDVDNQQAIFNYAIPPSNPFFDQVNTRGEIYAYGLRNPWRMSFDPITGLLWAGDVGQGEREEIDIIEAGGNYGWNFFEGTRCFMGDCDDTGLISPVFEYNHDNNDRSITGGYVYRGTLVPSLVGKYVYADFITGRIWALEATQNNPENELLVESGLNISSFGVDNANELYICSFDGSIYRLVEN